MPEYSICLIKFVCIEIKVVQVDWISYEEEGDR